MMVERVVLNEVSMESAPLGPLVKRGARARRLHHGGLERVFSTRGKRLRIRMRRLRCSGFAGHLCIHHVDF